MKIRYRIGLVTEALIGHPPNFNSIKYFNKYALYSSGMCKRELKLTCFLILQTTTDTGQTSLTALSTTPRRAFQH